MMLDSDMVSSSDDYLVKELQHIPANNTVE